jgi:hypothetical protein
MDKNGKTVTVYNYYVVYACDPNVWSKLVTKYLYDLTAKIAAAGTTPADTDYIAALAALAGIE